MKVISERQIKINLVRFFEYTTSKFFSEKYALYALYYLHFGRFPDLNNPSTFTEKIQYRKLNEHDHRMPKLIDKISVKDFVRDKIGQDWIIPTLWSGTCLPPRDRRNWPIPYVLKASHGCNWNIFIRTKEDEDWNVIEEKSRGWLSRHYAPYSVQWAYSRLTPCLLVEPYVGSSTHLPLDYKLLTFGGKVKFIQVDTGRGINPKRAIFDIKWQRQPFTIGFPMETDYIEPPTSLNEMIFAAEELANGFSFVRIDFYEIDGEPKFGEMTFYPGSGFSKFQPANYDRMLGELWR